MRRTQGNSRIECLRSPEVLLQMAERGSGGSLCEGMDIEAAAPTSTDLHINTQDEADDHNKTGLQSALETIHKGLRSITPALRSPFR